MMIPPLPVDHIGIAVTSIDDSIKIYTEKFGHTLSHREVLTTEQLEVAFLENGSATLELISPTSDTGTVAKFLKTRGPGMHHVCLRTPDIVAELKRLADSGVRLIDTSPRTGSRGKQIAFLHPSSTGGVLIELCQKS